jgi:EAL domain-containing protein (putative c-di-GMP-specific phosphodiesterase class I)/FixJ family two-component response regulator
MSENRLLVIDDQPEFATFVARVARMAGYEARETTTPDAFRNLFASWGPTHVVLDLMVPDVDGVELLRFLAEQTLKAKIIILSGMEPRVLEAAGRLAEARGLEVVSTLQKPVRAADLHAIFADAKAVARAMDDARAVTNWVTDEELARGLDQQEFFLEFQPKVILETMAVAGFEALVRWRHPERGIVPPMDFILAAEQSPLIDRLTLYVISAALGQLRTWREQGFETSVAVNVSGRNLHALDFAASIFDLCREFELPSQLLTLELTETALARDVVDAMDILTRIRLHGMRLSIDDFGVAYSSLVQLQSLPFSEIKIDRTFVSNYLTTPSATAIVNAIIDLAKNLSMRSVAEGVESEEMVSALRSRGCDLAQGYWIARPLVADAVPGWLEQWRNRVDPARISSASGS